MGADLLKSKATMNLKPWLHELGTESDRTAGLVQKEREEKGAGPPDNSHTGRGVVSPAERRIVWVAVAGEWGGCGDREEYLHLMAQSDLKAHILFFCRLGASGSKNLL